MCEPRYVSYDHKFVVVGRDGCPWCDKVCDLLTMHGFTYAYVNLTTNPEERNKLVNAGIKTVPQVYHKGDRIGGFEVTAEYLRGLVSGA